MFATLISLVFAALLIQLSPPLTLNYLALIPIVAGFIVFAIRPILEAFRQTSLQKSQKYISSQILSCYQLDLYLKSCSIFLLLFPIISIALGIAYLYIEESLQLYLFAFWAVLFGIALDCERYSSNLMLRYSNPYHALKLLAHRALLSIQNEKEADLCDWIDAIVETGIKGIQKDSSSIANEALNELQEVARVLFLTSKNIAIGVTDKQSESMGIRDRLSFTLFYLLQRIEMIHEKSLSKKQETVCSSVITNLGKIVMHAAKVDFDLPEQVILTLARCARKASEERYPLMRNKAVLTLQEVAKGMIQESDPTYFELKETYISLINQMHLMTQDMFKINKNIPISLLTQPFKDLKQFFSEAKISQHPDTPIILTRIEQILGEFDALEMVLRTIPPIPTFAEDDTSPAVPQGNP